MRNLIMALLVSVIMSMTTVVSAAMQEYNTTFINDGQELTILGYEKSVGAITTHDGIVSYYDFKNNTVEVYKDSELKGIISLTRRDMRKLKSLVSEIIAD